MFALLSRFPRLHHLPGVKHWLHRRLHKACVDNDLSTFQACLAAGLGVDVKIQNPQGLRGKLPLIFHVAHEGFEEGLRFLLAHGIDPMTTARAWSNKEVNNHLLMDLAELSHPKKLTAYSSMARRLVEAGACVDASRGWEVDWRTTFIDECGDPIAECAMLSFREVILMKHGAKPEWVEVLTFADALRRAREAASTLDEVLPATVMADAEHRRF